MDNSSDSNHNSSESTIGFYFDHLTLLRLHTRSFRIFDMFELIMNQHTSFIEFCINRFQSSYTDTDPDARNFGLYRTWKDLFDNMFLMDQVIPVINVGDGLWYLKVTQVDFALPRCRNMLQLHWIKRVNIFNPYYNDWNSVDNQYYSKAGFNEDYWDENDPDERNSIFVSRQYNEWEYIEYA